MNLGPPKNGDSKAVESIVSTNPETDDVSPAHQQAVLIHRIIARMIDVLLFGFLCLIYPVGILLGLLYLLFADGAWGGRSAGKALVGLKVVRACHTKPIGLRDSALRNIPMFIIGLFAMVPLIGWVLLLTFGVAITALEIYLSSTDPHGQRLGDVLARTWVVVAKPCWLKTTE